MNIVLTQKEFPVTMTEEEIDTLHEAIKVLHNIIEEAAKMGCECFYVQDEYRYFDGDIEEIIDHLHDLANITKITN